MVSAKSFSNSDAAVQSGTTQVLSPVPSEDELVAITMAVRAYMSDTECDQGQLDIYADQSAVKADNNLSCWLQSSRLMGTRSSFSMTNRPAARAGLWRSLLLLPMLAATMAGMAPAAVAADNAPGQNKATYYGTWNYKDQSQTVRVLLGMPCQKVDLDLPDGGSIYSADGGLVARVGPRSSWTLNLAYLPASASGYNRIASNAGRGRKFVFSGKSNLDIATTRGLSNGDIQNTAFAPSGGLPLENRFALTADDGYLVVPEARSTPGAVPLVGVGGKLYRGSLLLRPSQTFAAATIPGADKPPTSAIAVINIVKIEDYLLSVVPSEVPSSWPQEVLKAQAIAARSYVVANLGKHKADGYDVKDTVEDQVYRGVIYESNETNLACAGTNGLVIKQNDQVISAFFHSTSGGSTELAENVWSKPLPYLKSVVDYDDEAPLFTWQRSFTVQQLSKIMCPSGDTLNGIFVVGRNKTSGQRVKHLIAVGTNSGRVLTGSEVRKLLNLPSTQFSVLHADGAYVFSGKGYGHGLGLSQWGAKALADKGYNAGQILSYYYKDVTIESMGEPAGTNGSI